ncbi:ATP/GTP-binding protein [Neptunomonas sp.]|uniref:GTP-binding protein n=1 Tax=Neptunomonas sp. TaxID=1971898 RepID=UPI0025F07D9B|nr:ATP/GTP-binding protein [Neptunomonas sp.]
MKSYKVLFVGSPGSGKTTAIRTISDVEVVDTDTKASDSTLKRKRTTTVGMDYGKLSLGEGKVLHLYGTPGQERFKFMWDLMVSDLANDASALILLVDNTRNYPFRDIDFYLSEFWDFIVQRHFIIAVTRSDLKNEPTEAQYQNRLKEKGIFAPIIFIDARKSMDVMDLVMSSLNQEDDIDWAEVSHRVAVTELKNRNPDPDSPQFEWLRKTQDVPKISIVEAAMQVRGISGATHLDNTQKLIDTSDKELECNDLITSLAKLAAAIENKAPQLDPVRNISLYAPKKDSVSVFLEPDQSLGLLTLPSLTHKQIRQQAEDLLQWSDHVESTPEA